MLRGIQSYQIDSVWPDLEHLVLKALTKTGSIEDYDPSDLKELCKSQQMQCWVAHDDEIKAVCLTRILIFPKRKVFSLFLCAAKDNTFNEWFGFSDVLKAYGKANGCSAIRLGGRKGWIKKFGAKNATTLFTIGIDDG